MVVLTNFPPPTEGIKLREANTNAIIQTKDLGKGTLFIAESRVSWVGENGEGFSLEYPAISLHAISRDLTAFPQECLYLMIDAQLDSSTENQSDENGVETETEDLDKMSEIRFIPENKAKLDVMFKAMTDCQALHPDPTDSLSDDEDGYDDEEDEAEYDVSAAERQYGQADSNGDRGDDNEPMELGQFEDADPDH